MIKSLSIPQVPIIPVLLPSESVHLAKQLAQQHPKRLQAEYIYQRLLSVLAVTHYLKMLGIQTDLSQCDCWNPFLRMTTHSADLEVVGYGRFECCPVSIPSPSKDPSSSENMSSTDGAELPIKCSVPAEVQTDRVGYIAVQIEGALTHDAPAIHLLGFIDQINGEEWSLSERRSLFELPYYLEQLAPKKEVTHLTHWLKKRVDKSWKSLEILFNHQQQSPFHVRTLNVLRSSDPVRGHARCMYGKTLSLDTEGGETQIVLITEVLENDTDELSIELKICPTSPDSPNLDQTAFLPPGLEMVILDVAGESVMQAQARAGNRMMELGFHAEVGDRFQLRVTLGDTVVTESFLV